MITRNMLCKLNGAGAAFFVILFVSSLNLKAATHHVVMPGTASVTPTDPFTNWTTAGTNIIDVVNAAATNSAPRLVLVTNGTYFPTSAFYMVKTMTIRSVNGYSNTVFSGDALYTNRSRCTGFSTEAGSEFNGFTVSNYNVGGGAQGSFYGGQNGSILNCLFVRNSNTWFAGEGGGLGGAIFFVNGGTITNCVFRNNWSVSWGGAIYAYGGGRTTVIGCRFENNKAQNYHGGACDFPEGNAVVSNCFLFNNTASGKGGAFYFTGTNNSYVFNCEITGNVVHGQGTTKHGLGGGVFGETNVTIRNSLVALNSTTTNGGGVYLLDGVVESCTIVSNYAAISGGGLYIAGSARGTNNIVYFNRTGGGVETYNFVNTTGDTGLDYSCVIPAVSGTANTTNDPMFIDFNAGNYRLHNSPCVNTGNNQDWMTNAVDLNGRARIRYGTVDMGAYERINDGTIYTVH